MQLFPPGQDHLLYVKRGAESQFPLNCYKYNRCPSPPRRFNISLRLVDQQQIKSVLAIS